MLKKEDLPTWVIIISSTSGVMFLLEEPKKQSAAIAEDTIQDLSEYAYLDGTISQVTSFVR